MKNKNVLTRAQHVRFARKASRLLAMAQTMAKCLPEELGTPVAEGFAESAIESASEALALLTRVKCSLRIERNDKRLSALANTVSLSELDALAEIRNGGDVFSPALARTLRDVQRRHPDWLTIRPAPDVAGGQKPFFGAMLTGTGREVVEFVKGGAE